MQNHTKIIVLLFFLVGIVGCDTTPKIEVELPEYSMKMLELGEGCTCDIGDNLSVGCNCPYNIRFECRKAPSNMLEAITDCWGFQK